MRIFFRIIKDDLSSPWILLHQRLLLPPPVEVVAAGDLFPRLQEVPPGEGEDWERWPVPGSLTFTDRHWHVHQYLTWGCPTTLQYSNRSGEGHPTHLLHHLTVQTALFSMFHGHLPARRENCFSSCVKHVGALAHHESLWPGQAQIQQWHSVWDQDTCKALLRSRLPASTSLRWKLFRLLLQSASFPLITIQWKYLHYPHFHGKWF